MFFAFKALLVLSFSLLVGCSKYSTEPKLDEPILTPIEDLGFSHDVEADEWDGVEKVYAKFTAQWYVDPNDPERVGMLNGRVTSCAREKYFWMVPALCG